MADEIQGTHTTERGVPIHPAAPGATSAVSDDPEAARDEIQATRARISETIDEIEEVLLHKKERIEEKLDVLAPVKQQPMKTLGIVFGAGLVLGLLTGGGDDEEEDEGEDEASRRLEFRGSAEERAELWEGRARRLLRIAREQEEEIGSLRSPRGRALRERWEEVKEEGLDRWEDVKDGAEELADDGLSVLARVREYLSENFSSIVSDSLVDTVRHVVRR